jgi:cation diffusion facilitator family transporter
MRMSYGYHRSEILGALFSTLVIWVLTGALVYMAILRVIDPTFAVEPVPMLVTASCGVVFNIIMWLVLHTNVCFKGINLGHHGHSHSGDGHGHGHSHGGASAAKASSNHGHSHSDGDSHGHSHASAKPAVASTSNSHGHSHSGAEGDHGHSHSHSHSKVSDVRTKSNASSDAFSIPINDNFSMSANVNGEEPASTVLQCDGDDENHAEVEVNDSTNINLRAAAIHVIGDFVQSIGVLIAAIFIYVDVIKLNLKYYLSVTVQKTYFFLFL